MKNPLEIKVNPTKITTDNIRQIVLHLGQREKQDYLLNQILSEKDIYAIVFTNYKTKVPYLTNMLRKYNIQAVGISSALEQRKRKKLLSDFKDGVL